MNTPIIEQRALQQPLEQYQTLTSLTIARILSARNVQIDDLDLQLKHLLQPNLLGLTPAIERIDQAIENNEKILIVGDYDADGATSTALMVLALKDMGARVEYIVPDRFKYGYGLTPAIADLAYQTHAPQLLITVDNGISSHDGVEKCHELGIEVIITDHHLTTKATPNAQAVVNPNQLGCLFPSKALAGVGVAFYVLASLSTYRKKLGKSSTLLTQYLDLVALGTVADVARLDFNNRILVEAGLDKIRKRQCRAGILALLDIAGKQPENLQASDLGFTIGPRINAAGRMDSMQIGIECLIAPDLEHAYPIAYQLDQFNVDRRQVEQQMKSQAMDYLQNLQLEENSLPPALILFEPEWHQGVIGIVAGRLKEHFHRPSIVFALDDEGKNLKGSARSIDGIHIRDAIEAVAQEFPYLVKYFGGHAAAAGLTIDLNYFEEFKERFTHLIEKSNPELFQAKILTDGCLDLTEFNLDFLTQIENLGPWGQGFELPIFDGIFDVVDYQWLKEVHLKIRLALTDGQVIEAIGFQMKGKVPDHLGHKIRLAYRLDKNEFRGNSKLQLKILYLENI